jgi:hypothetical protein
MSLNGTADSRRISRGAETSGKQAAVEREGERGFPGESSIPTEETETLERQLRRSSFGRNFAVDLIQGSVLQSTTFNAQF